MSLKYWFLPDLVFFEVLEGVVIRAWHKLSPISNHCSEWDPLCGLKLQSGAKWDSGLESSINGIGSWTREFGLLNLPLLRLWFLILKCNH